MLFGSFAVRSPAFPQQSLLFLAFAFPAVQVCAQPFRCDAKRSTSKLCPSYAQPCFSVVTRAVDLRFRRPATRSCSMPWPLNSMPRHCLSAPCFAIAQLVLASPRSALALLSSHASLFLCRSSLRKTNPTLFSAKAYKAIPLPLQSSPGGSIAKPASPSNSVALRRTVRIPYCRRSRFRHRPVPPKGSGPCRSCATGRVREGCRSPAIPARRRSACHPCRVCRR